MSVFDLLSVHLFMCVCSVCVNVRTCVCSECVYVGTCVCVYARAYVFVYGMCVFVRMSVVMCVSV